MLTTLKNDLQHATPESQGVASSTILRWVEAVEAEIHEFHSFVLVRHGKIVAEGWWSPYGRSLPHMMFSLSKSFTSTAIGLAVSEGRLSIDDPVLSFFPGDTPAEVSPNLAAMRVRHLLSMSTGHDADTMDKLFEAGEKGWAKAFLALPVQYQPGTHFLYNTGASFMLSAIVQKVTGMKLVDYLTPRLFEPLGIENATWEESPEGINMGGFGLNIKTGDIARFGQLYLQKGLWNGTQLLPEAWVEQATLFQVSNGDNPTSDWAQGYGFQFWRCRHNAYRGDGAFGQYCVVMPDQDAVLALTSGVADMQQPLDLVWDILLPAMTTAPLPEDAAAQDALTTKLDSLTFATVEGQATSPTASRVLGRTYSIEANERQIEAITLTASGSGWDIRFKTAVGDEHFPCGYQTWAKGQTGLFNPRPEDTRTQAVVASGAWTADNTFSAIVRLNETPFFHQFVCHFDGDRLTLKTKINVWFAPPETMVFTGVTKP